MYLPPLTIHYRQIAICIYIVENVNWKHVIKWKSKYTTLSEQLQKPIEESYKEANSITLTHITMADTHMTMADTHMTMADTHMTMADFFLRFVQAFQ